jgi:hypothetical protein
MAGKTIDRGQEGRIPDGPVRGRDPCLGVRPGPGEIPRKPVEVDLVRAERSLVDEDESDPYRERHDEKHREPGRNSHPDPPE